MSVLMKGYTYEVIVPLGKKRKKGGEYCEFVIYARTVVRSAALLVGFQFILADIKDRWNPDSMETWTYSGKIAQIAENLARGVEGLATYEHDTGWTIIPWPEKKYGNILAPFWRGD